MLGCHSHPGLFRDVFGQLGAQFKAVPFRVAVQLRGGLRDLVGQFLDQRIGPNDELFGMIYTIDEDDDWTDPAILRKANPNFDISVYGDYLESQQKQAINNPRFTNKFKTKHLNVWVSAKESFFNMVSWENCRDDSLTLDDFAGEDVVLGLDMARKLDMNSLVPE